MMADSPEKDSDSYLRLTVLSNGRAINDDLAVLSVFVTRKAGQIPFARIELEDGDVPTQDFPLSGAGTFQPGAQITIKAGYESSDAVIFEGLVLKHGIRVNSLGPDRLVLECRDKAVAMTVGRKNANYVERKDSEVLTSLIADHSGLKADVDATNVVREELVQYYCTDWDFMVSRAEANGLLVLVDDGTVSVKAPKTPAPVLTVSYGTDLIEFEADVDAGSQFTEAQGFSWDPKTQEVLEGKAERPTDIGKQGNLTGNGLAEVLNASATLQTAAPMGGEALKAWGAGQQMKSGLARIRGRVKFQGNAKPKPGTQIELEGVGDRFNGNVYVTAVNHEINAQGWTTEAEFGLAPDWHADRRDLTAPPAAGLLPGVDGLQIGVVKQLDKDPGGENRIQVSVPLLQAKDDGIWARMASFYGSEKGGAFFVPDIGDEVILGYLNGDPTSPVILGSLYSSNHKPPYPLTAENFIRAVTTKEGLKIELDDEDKVVTLATPAGNTVTLNDAEESIVLTDQTGNKVTLDESGIELKSNRDISIDAGGKVSIKANGAVAIESRADVMIEGNNVTNSAKSKFTGKGSASAELSASGQTVVKGAMVMIN